MSEKINLNDYKFKTEPYQIQKEWLVENALKQGAALFWTMATGKTKVVIDNAYILFQEGKIDAVLVITEKNVYTNWSNKEIPEHGWSDSCPIFVYKAETKEDKLRQEFSGVSNSDGLKFYLFNNSSLVTPRALKLMVELLKNKRTMLVADESHNFKNHTSRQTKQIIKIAKHCSYKRIMTGTAITNCASDIFWQLSIICEKPFGDLRWTAFKDHILRYKLSRGAGGVMFPQKIGYKNLDIVENAIAQFGHVIQRGDNDLLSELVEHVHKIGTSDDTKNMYKTIEKDLIIELENVDTKEIVGAMSKTIKLEQALSGFVANEDGSIVRFSDCRALALKKLLEKIEGKTLIFCKFREDVSFLKDYLKDYNPLTFVGGMTDEQKQNVKDRMDLGVVNDNRIIIATTAASTGIRFKACSNIVWFSLVDKNILIEQSKERCTGYDDRVINIYYLDAGGIDSAKIERMKKKSQMAEIILENGKVKKDVFRID